MKPGYAVLIAATVGGCNLVDVNTFNIPYSFDAQHFTRTFANSSSTVPNAPCSPSLDPCAAAQANLPPGAQATISCDTGAGSCVATAELRLLYPVDLTKAQTPLPSQAVQLGIDHADLSKIAYWVMANSLNVDTPPIDLFVAPAEARDETQGTLLGSVATLPAGSAACGDKPDGSGDPAAAGAMVCDLPLQAAGKSQLQQFVKNFKTTPFQIIAHTVVTAHAGDPVPSGTIDFWVRPTVNLNILK
jgi:hypothetical protein